MRDFTYYMYAMIFIVVLGYITLCQSDIDAIKSSFFNKNIVVKDTHQVDGFLELSPQFEVTTNKGNYRVALSRSNYFSSVKVQKVVSVGR